MSVRAKFAVSSIEKSKYGEEELSTVKLTAVADGSDENKTFFRWTPNGQITLATVNPAAAGQFEQGASYYVDFTKAEGVKP